MTTSFDFVQKIFLITPFTANSSEFIITCRREKLTVEYDESFGMGNSCLNLVIRMIRVINRREGKNNIDHSLTIGLSNATNLFI